MFYFERFFYEFKKEIFKNRGRKINIVDGTLLALTIILGLAALALFDWNHWKLLILVLLYL